MMLTDFSDGHYGYCASMIDDTTGKEVVLSQCFKEGTKGVGDAMRTMVDQMNTIPTISFRWSMLMTGIKMEQKGMKLTGKTSDSSAIVKREFGMRNVSKRKTELAFGMLISLACMLKDEGETHVR